MLICGKSQAVLRGISPDYGSGPSGLIIASAPGVCAWATPFCPFLAKTGGSRWDLVAIYFWSSSSSIQTVYMSLSTGGYFTSTTAGRNVGESFSPGVQRAQHAAPPKRHFSCVAPYSRMCSSLSPSNAAALTTHVTPSAALALTATVATPLLAHHH